MPLEIRISVLPQLFLDVSLVIIEPRRFRNREKRSVSLCLWASPWFHFTRLTYKRLLIDDFNFHVVRNICVHDISKCFFFQDL